MTLETLQTVQPAFCAALAFSDTKRFKTHPERTQERPEYENLFFLPRRLARVDGAVHKANANWRVQLQAGRLL